MTETPAWGLPLPPDSSLIATFPQVVRHQSQQLEDKLPAAIDAETRAQLAPIQADMADARTRSTQAMGSANLANHKADTAVETADAAEAKSENAVARVGYLETNAEMAPGSASDATMATHAAQDGGQFNTELKTQTADAVSVGGAARPVLDAITVARDATVNRVLDGTRLLIIGDSISILGTSGIQGQSHTTWYQWESGGRLHEVARTAQSGARADQQLASVTAYWNSAPANPATLAICQVGTNDLNQGIPMATWLDNVQAIVGLNAVNGCKTVLCTIPPRSGPANPKPPAVVNGEWNQALREYALAEGLPVVDNWGAVADPITGEWRPGEVDPADGVHPNYLGTRRMADEAKRTLYPLLAQPAEKRQAAGMTTRVAGEPGGMLPTPIFTKPGDPSTMGFATSTPADAWESAWDPEAPGGYAIELAATNPATRPDLMQRAFSTDGGWSDGDRLLFVATFRVLSSADIPPGSGIRVSLTQLPAGATGYGSFCFGQFMPTADWQTVRFEFTPDAGATEIRPTFQYIKPANTTNTIRARIGSMQIYNLTRLGI